MLNTPGVSLLLVLTAAILGAVGQFLFQTASKANGGGMRILMSPWALGGMLTYVTVMILFTSAFRLGGTVRVLYPIYATTFIWAALMALTLDGHAIRPINFAGMVLLMAGIICMSW